jgi:hypothetical protein
MLLRSLGTLVLVAAAPVTDRPALAQSSDVPTHVMERRWAIGGEVALVGTPREDTGFFNNTDYDVNALQMVRLRLSGEWRLTRTVTFVGDMRSDNGTEVLTPSAYVRWHPGGSLVMQAGRIPPAFGAFTRRPYGRDTVTLGEPLGYQYLTSLRPDALPATIEDVLRMRGRGWQPSYPVGSTAVRGGIPLVSVSSWDTGVEAMWTSDVVDVSGALTRGSTAVPVVEDLNDGLMGSGRVAVHGPAGLLAGASIARGQWVENSALDLTPQGRSTPSSQSAFGADLEIGVGPVLLRSEVIHSRFDVPLAVTGGAAALSATSLFVEGRYRFLPRWQIGVRADRLRFSDVRTAAGLSATWDANVERLEAMLGFRATRRLDLRIGWQQNWRDGGRVRRLGLPAAGLFYWF